jgi:hypothetical protein
LASSILTTGCWGKGVPAVAVEEGWVAIVNLAAPPPVIEKMELTAVVRAPAEAVRRLSLPAVGMVKSLKVASPPALVL